MEKLSNLGIKSKYQKLIDRLKWWAIPSKGCRGFCLVCKHFKQCVWEQYVDLCDTYMGGE